MMIGVERVLILSFFHTTFLPETSHFGSRPVSREKPFCSGPRKEVQSSRSALSCFTARLAGELAAVFVAVVWVRPEAAEVAGLVARRGVASVAGLAASVVGFLVAGAAALLDRVAADARGVLS